LAKLKGTRPQDEQLRLDGTYGSQRAIKDAVISRWCGELWTKPNALAALYERGITKENIISHRLGFTDGRIMIPFQDIFGQYVTGKRYKPGASHQKMLWMVGRPKTDYLYPRGQVESYDKIVIAGGEIKAISGTNLFNPEGFGCVSGTQGETSWSISYNRSFIGKTVYIAYDVDTSGRAGAQIVAKQLSTVADKVYIVTLPFKVDTPKGGLDDWIVQKGTFEEFLASAVEYTGPSSVIDSETPEPPTETTLSECYNPSMVGKPLLVKGDIAACAETPMVIPRSWKILCNKGEDCCGGCPFSFDGASDEPFQTKPDSTFVLTASSRADYTKALAQECGIPAACTKHRAEVVSNYAVTEVRLSSPISISASPEAASSSKQAQPALLVQTDYATLDQQNTYKLTCRLRPHPSSHISTLLVSEASAADDDLSNWSPSASDLENIDAYRSSGTVAERISRLALAVERKITYINNRYDMHTCMLLTYCSLLHIPYRQKHVRGWVESLIIGDSANGKTDAAMGLKDALRLGSSISCKTTSRAGLIGGNVKLDDSGKLFVKWGSLVQADRRLLIMEELKGLNKEVLGAMTDARSSGVAELNLAQPRKAFCRARIIALSNASSNRKLATYPFGVSAIAELIGAPEDIRRFDLCCVVSDTTQNIDESDEPTPDLDAPELLRTLVLFAWTCLAENIHKFPGVDEAVEASGKKLRGLYSSDIPIIDPGSTGLKVLRLACAAAALSGSISEEGVLEVTPEHVEWVENFLHSMYSSPDVGYKAYSDAHRMSNQFTEEQKAAVLFEIRSVPTPRNLFLHLFRTDYVDVLDVQQFAALQDVSAEEFIKNLRVLGALRRTGSGARVTYTKTLQFSALLREYEVREDFESLFPITTVQHL